jgi:eukaryotic-like serine/threonine-protein kinase
MTEATQTNVPPTSEAPVPIDLTGRTIGDFQILRRLGQGGMGQVYLAEQRSLKRKVALKILRGDLAANATSLQRFKQEAEAVAQATHANIVQVYAFGEADGLTYMALEYVEGRNLKEYLTKKGPPELLLALSFMRQIAAALQRASELGIIHRDIKPENILLTRKGEVKVADFGLSRVVNGDQQPLNLTQSGVSMGTPLYMAPEQVEGKPVDSRTDIYSFGVTCYHLMTGQPPFTGTNAFEVALAHVRTEPPPLQTVRPDLPEAFCAVIHKMMAKDPAQRYQTCRELLKDLSKVRESLAGVTTAFKADELGVELLPLNESGEGTTGQTPRRGPSVPQLPARRRRKLLLALAVLTVFLALGGGAALAWLRFGWPEKPDAALPVNKPADLAEADAVVDARKREQVLRDAAEQYLNPQNAAKNPQTGFGVCMDLGLCYLEQHKLDDAETFFTRLENLKQVESYHVLGRVGRAIVLALRSQAKESNALFKEVFPGRNLGDAAPKGGAGKKVQPREQLLQNPSMRYWLAQAIYYNERNGVARTDLPLRLRTFPDQGAVPPKP